MELITERVAKMEFISDLLDDVATIFQNESEITIGEEDSKMIACRRLSTVIVIMDALRSQLLLRPEYGEWCVEIMGAVGKTSPDELRWDEFQEDTRANQINSVIEVYHYVINGLIEDSSTIEGKLVKEYRMNSLLEHYRRNANLYPQNGLARLLSVEDVLRYTFDFL